MPHPLPPLRPGATVLTANRRLARALRAAHAEERWHAGDVVWESPDILPYAAWLERTWQDYADGAAEAQPLWLDAEPERVLWERVIREGVARRKDTPLLQVPAAASAAQRTHGLLRAHRCELDPDDVAGHEDAAAFRRWTESFRRRCAEAGWIDAGAAAERLVGALGRGAVAVPGRLILAGFDRYTPQQRALWAALAAAGTAVDEWQPPPGAGRARRLALADTRQELETAARWARSLLERGVGSVGAPIAVVVPNLEAVRAEVEAIFDDVLRPAAHYPGVAHASRPYNLSLGPPLAQTPVVADALRILSLLAGPLPAPELSVLLRSPHLGAAERERDARARVDAWLRGRARVEWDAASLRAALARAPPNAGRGVPALVHALEVLAHARRDARTRRPATRWAERFWGVLRAVGWPGERLCDGAEHQAVEALHEELARLAASAAAAGAESAAGAHARLARLARERIFQPQSPPAPVQIMGLLEAGGQRFSRLWVSGLHDGAWPAPARPDPFLPVALQRRYEMPHASPALELAFARRVSARLLASADEVWLSHPRQSGDERLGPSPLIEAVQPAGAPEPAPAAVMVPVRHVHEAGAPLETLADERGPPLGAARPARGGAALFRDQAACPFRAFARHRLGARGLEAPAPRADARRRGIVVHRLMAALWGALGGNAGLRESAPEALERVLEDAVTAALAETVPELPARARRRHLELEGARLRALAREWLGVEVQRAPFEVCAREAELEVEVGGVRVAVRLDRADRLGDGRVLLLDYKTRPASPSGWLGPRPDEPQLPLYCLGLGEAVAGAAYATLARGACGLRGLGAEALVPGVDAVGSSRLPAARAAGDWEGLKERWRGVLGALGREIAAGEARVAPKAPPGTCRRCDLHPLCRIHEQGGAAAEAAGAPE